jgi:hypothetical protein
VSRVAFELLKKPALGLIKFHTIKAAESTPVQFHRLPDVLVYDFKHIDISKRL